MAIQKTVELDELGGLTVTDAYVSIETVRVSSRYADGSKLWKLIAAVNIHVSRQAKIDGHSPVHQTMFEGEFPADQVINPLVWIYDQLKQTDQFTGAVDVIE